MPNGDAIQPVDTEKRRQLEGSMMVTLDAYRAASLTKIIAFWLMTLVLLTLLTSFFYCQSKVASSLFCSSFVGYSVW
jgi:hypothetical protein